MAKDAIATSSPLFDQRTQLRSAFEAGSFDDANKICSEILSHHPHDEEALVYRARLLNSEGNLIGEKEILVKLVELYPGKATHARKAMRASWKIDDFAGTIEFAQSLLRLQPSDAEAIKLGLRAAIQAESWDQIASLGTVAVQAEPALALNAAKKLVGQGRLIEAANIFALLTQGSSIHEPARERLGWIVQRLFSKGNAAVEDGEVALGASYYRAGIGLDPGHSQMGRRLRRLRSTAIAVAQEANQSGSLRERYEAWMRALDIEPDNRSALKNASQAAAGLDMRDVVARMQSRLLELAPEDPDALRKFVSAAEKNGDDASALDALLKAGLNEATHPKAMSLCRKVAKRAREQFEAGDYGEAQRGIAIVLEADPENARALQIQNHLQKHFRRVMVQARDSGDSAAAVAAAEQLLESNSRSAEALEFLGRHALKEKRFSDAVSLLTQMSEVLPDAAKSWIYLSRALKAANEPEAAGKAIRRALQLAPSDPRVQELAQKLGH